VVALDDALALTLYALGTSAAGILTGHSGSGAGLMAAAYELGVALVVGIIGGGILKAALARIREEEAELTFAIGAVLLTIGLSIALKLDVILSSMTLGLTLVNAAPRRSQKTFEMVKRFAPPIYVLFFVLVGARLKVENMSLLAWLLVVAYVLGRSAGKIGGAWLGGKWSGAARSVRKYLGVCLFAQGGVAIGLSILASHRFTDEISSIVILVVASTTFIVQLLGPLFIKLGVQRAGEIGLNVREEDLIDAYRVNDVMNREVPVVPAGMPLAELIQLVSRTETNYYPVVGRDHRLLGAVTLHGIRNTFATQELNEWLVALDVMEPAVATIAPEMPLSDAFEKAKGHRLEYLPVVNSGQDGVLAGLLDCQAVRRALSAEVLSRQEKADSMRGT
jgi:CBS domain-containing protein